MSAHWLHSSGILFILRWHVSHIESLLLTAGKPVNMHCKSERLNENNTRQTCTLGYTNYLQRTFCLGLCSLFQLAILTSSLYQLISDLKLTLCTSYGGGLRIPKLSDQSTLKKGSTPWGPLCTYGNQ